MQRQLVHGHAAPVNLPPDQNCGFGSSRLTAILIISQFFSLERKLQRVIIESQLTLYGVKVSANSGVKGFRPIFFPEVSHFPAETDQSQGDKI